MTPLFNTYSQWMWDTFAAAAPVSSNPPQKDVVDKWLKSLSGALKATILYSEATQKLLVNRIKHLRKKVHWSQGGRQKKQFLEKYWIFAVESRYVVFSEDLEKKNSQLKERIIELEEKVLEHGSIIKKVMEGKKDRGRKRSLEEYSDRQNRRLKSKRTKSCETSLSWLEKEGYTPLKV